LGTDRLEPTLIFEPFCLVLDAVWSLTTTLILGPAAVVLSGSILPVNPLIWSIWKSAVRAVYECFAVVKILEMACCFMLSI
jgi:hypothetical protein